jgi:hypothetical protein
MRTQAPIALVAVLAACGGGPAATTIPGPATSAPPVATSAPVITTTSPVSASAVVAITSGRGDDESFEVVVWLDAPLQGQDLLVGFDSSVSYASGSDPIAGLDGWAVIGETASVVVDGAVVAEGDRDAVGDWISWSITDSVVRVYFLERVAPLTGSVWVRVGDGPTPASVAGARVGEGCAHEPSGIEPPPEVERGLACLSV